MLFANADVPAPPPVQTVQVIHTKHDSRADCQIRDMVFRIRANSIAAFSPVDGVKCFAGNPKQSVELETIDASKLPAGIKVFNPQKFCQTGTALYLIKPGKGRSAVCEPKGVKAGIRG